LVSATEQLRFRMFRDMPGRDFVEAFKAHVRDTGQPETFDGLHPGPLAKAEPFEKLASFDIDRRKRPDGDMAACPMCRRTDKYLLGALAYFPQLQAVAAIGHCCADKENLAAAERRFTQRRTRDQEEDYLLAELPLVHSRLAVIERARPAAVEARRVHRQFRKEAPEIQQMLRVVKKAGGRLIVSERMATAAAGVGPSGFRNGGQISTQDADFGVLRGLIAITANYDPVDELDRVVELLRPLDQGETEEAAIDYIADLDGPSRHRATVSLRDAEPSYSKFRSRLAEFCAFFAPENIDQIGSWASHRAHPQPFTASTTIGRDGSVACQFRSRSALICHLTVGSIIRTFDHPWPRSG
jgi:hypothetical protein